jgi:uroporphyrinogen-III decarboxylase
MSPISSRKIVPRLACSNLPMRRVKALLDARGVDLIFHDCGELTDGMVKRFATLDAAMLSFGCSRQLWEDAAMIPKSTVLYGNLPTKKFMSSQLTVAEVERLAKSLVEKMREAGHPFILGSECDVLSVPGSEREILAKVEAFMRIS